jgi:carboxypeptidase family protein
MRLSAAVCLIAILFAGALIGQTEDTGTRSVQGIVADASGKPVAGAIVQLKDTKSLQIRSYRTEADGRYHFAGLSTNVEYELEARHDVLGSRKKTLTVFNTKKAATVNLKLKK